jgi:hypothetical protein
MVGFDDHRHLPPAVADVKRIAARIVTPPPFAPTVVFLMLNETPGATFFGDAPAATAPASITPAVIPTARTLEKSVAVYRLLRRIAPGRTIAPSW